MRGLLTRRFLHVLGLAAVLPLVAVDPAAVVMLLDAEFLALVGGAGLALLRGDAEIVLHRILSSAVVMDLRTGFVLTREEPRSLLQC